MTLQYIPLTMSSHAPILVPNVKDGLALSLLNIQHKFISTQCWGVPHTPFGWQDVSYVTHNSCVPCRPIGRGDNLVSMFMEHMHVTGEATWCDWCFNEGEMSVSLMPLHNRFCLVTSLSCRVSKRSLTASRAQLHSGTGQLSPVT